MELTALIERCERIEAKLQRAQSQTSAALELAVELALIFRGMPPLPKLGTCLDLSADALEKGSHPAWRSFFKHPDRIEISGLRVNGRAV